MPNPDFVPKMRLIGGITNASNAVVTTTVNHGYNSNARVMLVIPRNYGMFIDYEEATITVTGATTFSCDKDTSTMDPFVAPGAPFTPAHVCNVSEVVDNIAI